MSEWQPIETVPRGKIVLMFGVTDIKEDGSASNWKMATGSLNVLNSQGDRWLEWGGHIIRSWDVPPTHWMPLPEPPK